MGVPPLQFVAGESVQPLGLTGEETYTITGLADHEGVPHMVTIRTNLPEGSHEFAADVRIDTPAEAEYYRHGGILHYALRQLLRA